MVVNENEIHFEGYVFYQNKILIKSQNDWIILKVSQVESAS